MYARRVDAQRGRERVDAAGPVADVGRGVAAAGHALEDEVVRGLRVEEAPARRRARGDAREALVADKKVMKTFASKPFDAAKLPDHLAAADAAVAALRAAAGGDASDAPDDVRLAALKKRQRTGD